jgi:hypothetical protein
MKRLLPFPGTGFFIPRSEPDARVSLHPALHAWPLPGVCLTDGFHEIQVNTMEGFWSLLRSWLRPQRGVAQEKLPLHLACFQLLVAVKIRA